jgi:septum site-determining protein MinC
VVIQKRQSLLFQARSYLAFVLTPRLPIEDWLADLDASVERSKGFFANHAVALDLSGSNFDSDAITSLVGKLNERRIRVLGIEGGVPTAPGNRLPPSLRGGRDTLSFQLPGEAVVVGDAAAPKQQRTASLLVEEPVRSGQSIVFPDGDITVVGSVGSGAEVIAGGSIHIYGTLRGRALAGVTGNGRARIFCRRVEAEFLAIDSYYKVADDIGDDIRKRPAQVWLEGKTLRISALH